MILVDSSVFIDQLKGRTTLQTIMLDRWLADGEDIAIGDLVLVEVLQGSRDEGHLRRLHSRFSAFTAITVAGHGIATQAARHYQHLRALGITVRKTIDTLIATRCIVDSIPLLYSDRDFDPFVQHCGLRSAMDLYPEAN